MRPKEDYFISTTPDSLLASSRLIYKKVFRTDLTEPGFIVIDLGFTLGSQELRKYMVLLKNELSELHIDRFKQKLMYQWMGRFDQQETTKFHLDNAADQSFLMLGYEPTKIKSKLYFADYIQLAASMKISGEEYFEKYNPMFTNNESLLTPFITEVEGFREDTFKIVLVNNSNTRTNETKGVFHKAEIIQKNLSEDRVINSTMIYAANVDDHESYSSSQQEEFIITNKISKK